MWIDSRAWRGQCRVAIHIVSASKLVNSKFNQTGLMKCVFAENQEGPACQALDGSFQKNQSDSDKQSPPNEVILESNGEATFFLKSCENLEFSRNGFSPRCGSRRGFSASKVWMRSSELDWRASRAPFDRRNMTEERCGVLTVVPC